MYEEIQMRRRCNSCKGDPDIVASWKLMHHILTPLGLQTVVR